MLRGLRASLKGRSGPFYDRLFLYSLHTFESVFRGNASGLSRLADGGFRLLFLPLAFLTAAVQ